MTAIVRRESAIAATAPRGSPPTSVTSDASIATSAPVPIAIPRSAAASAGASLIPSPTIATTWPAACSAATLAALSAGQDLGQDPLRRDADLRARPPRPWPGGRPVTSQASIPWASRARTASAASGLTGSAIDEQPDAPPRRRRRRRGSARRRPAPRPATASGAEVDAALGRGGGHCRRRTVRPSTIASAPPPGDRREAARAPGNASPRSRAAGEDRRGERVLAAGLHGGRQPEELVPGRPPGDRHDLRDGRLPERERARLVEDDRGHPMGRSRAPRRRGRGCRPRRRARCRP